MLTNRKLWKVMFLVVMVAGAVILLAVATDFAEAQGPGGSGRGNNAWNRNQTAANTQNANAVQLRTNQAAMLRQQANPLGTNLPPASALPLSDTAQAALREVLQDEVNAYATYQAVIDQFGAVRPFTNIQAAEAQHMAALEFLYERYGLDVPALAPTIAAPQFARVSEACAAGAAAEVANFGLYDRWIAQVSDYPDLVQVFTALRDASQYSHLPALERCAG